VLKAERGTLKTAYTLKKRQFELRELHSRTEPLVRE